MELPHPATLIAAPGPTWDSVLTRANAWRGACLHHFTAAELAITETLLALADRPDAEVPVRLRHLIGQRFEDLEAALGSEALPGGPRRIRAHEAMRRFRERHEPLRTLLCHGHVRIAVEPHDRWLVIVRVLSIRARAADEQVTVIDQRQAEARLAALKSDRQSLASALGELRKALGIG